MAEEMKRFTATIRQNGGPGRRRGGGRRAVLMAQAPRPRQAAAGSRARGSGRWWSATTR